MDHMRKANVVDQAAFACYHQSSCLFFPRRIVNWTARIFQVPTTKDLATLDLNLSQTILTNS